MDWDDLDIFCHVIDHGSFSGAARILRRPKSSVSAAVARLEGRLGTRVIERTTRRLRLTEAGESLYREMSPLFAHLREALGNAAAMGETVSGRLRIAAPYEFGAHHLGAVACAMLAEHPELEVDVEVEHQPVNLFDNQYDIVFTMIDRELPSTSGVVRRVFSLERGLFAAPAMFRRARCRCRRTTSRPCPCWRRRRTPTGSSRMPPGPPLDRRCGAAPAQLQRRNQAASGVGRPWRGTDYGDLLRARGSGGAARRLLTDFECAPLRVYALLPAGG